MSQKQRIYFCIDMKSFYASVECAERQLNPFETCLVVADETRGEHALCLAISPKMKALGVKNRYEVVSGELQIVDGTFSAFSLCLAETAPLTTMEIALTLVCQGDLQCFQRFGQSHLR